MDAGKDIERIRCDIGSKNEDRDKEAFALARMISYARQNADGLEMEFVAYCLDMAIQGIFEELNGKAETWTKQ